jgi:hypothetical protein
MELRDANSLNGKVNRKKFEFTLLNNCTEPGRVIGYTREQALSLKSKKDKRSIELIRDGKSIEKFEVLEFREHRINRYPWVIKILKLRRM